MKNGIVVSCFTKIIKLNHFCAILTYKSEAYKETSVFYSS